MKIVSFLLLLICCFALPREDQLTLASSLMVGRDGYD